MITISLCMIVKNEENTLEKCLSSAKGIADEIIIVDTGSTDSTKKIASKFTDKIFDFEWINDFSVARNFSFSHATMDYIMWLDADDVLLPMDIVKLSELKSNLSENVDVVMMRYNTGFDAGGKVTFSYFRERLSKRERDFRWIEPVHEHLEIWGNIINAEICITHTKQHTEKSTRNIEIYENSLANGKELSARGMYYYARELKDHGRYNNAIEMFNLFLESGEGWIEDNIASCEALAKCYQSIGNREKALESMMRSFTFDTPRAEICCLIGYHFKAVENYKLAAFWFELVFSLTREKENWGFCQEDCWGYIPAIECAVCCDKLGDRKKGKHYNDKAYEYKPESLVVLYNKIYFDDILMSS